MSAASPRSGSAALRFLLVFVLFLGSLGIGYFDRVLTGVMLIGVLAQLERAMRETKGVLATVEGRSVAIGVAGFALAALLLRQELRWATSAAMWMLSSDAIVLRYSAGAIPGMVLVLGLAWWMGMRMVSRRVGADATLRRTRSAAVGDRADPVNVNEASTEELARVRYVGSSLAARMVAHREEHGPFRSEADLIAVDGIGPRSVKRLLPGLRFGAPEPDGRDSLAETGATSGVPIGTPASTGRTFAIVVIGWAVSAAAGGQIIGLCIAFGVTAWFLAKAQGGRSALRVPARRTSFAVWLGALAVGGSLFGAVGAGWYSGHLVDMRFGAARAAALSWPDLAQPWVMGQAALLLLAWMAALLLARRAPAGPTP